MPRASSAPDGAGRPSAGTPGASRAWAVAARDVHLVYLPVDAKWDACRNDVAFARLLDACGFTARPSAPLEPGRL